MRNKIRKVYSFDWPTIQERYNSGASYRVLETEFGVNAPTIIQAKKLNLFISRTLKEASDLYFSKLSKEEIRLKLSHKGNPNGKMGGYREKAGRSKKFYVLDSFGNKICLQSSYEKRVAEILDDLKIKWTRPSFLRYDDKKYFPDFLLVEKGIYLDPKNNFLAKKDEEKIKKVCEQNNVRVIVLQEKEINYDFILNL
jgi:hypothetical protein